MCFEGKYNVSPSVDSAGACNGKGCWDWRLAKDNLAFGIRRYSVKNGDHVIFVCNTPLGGRHVVAVARFAGVASPHEEIYYQFPIKDLEILSLRDCRPLAAITKREYKQGTCLLEGAEARTAWKAAKGRGTPLPNRVFHEGYPSEVVVKQGYRNAALTKQAKAKYGVTCCACGFDFEAVYGELGRGYIQVHHLKSIAAGKTTNTVGDVRVVCANCHVMLHQRGEEPLTVGQLRRLVELNAKGG
jgi:hypothetical protein